MFTVKQVATALGISNTLLRQRGAEYADYLSDNANPGKGKERKYTESDVATLQTIGVLKSQNATDDDILAALDAGDILEPVEMPNQEPRKDDKSLVTSEFAAALTAYETQVSNQQKKIYELHDKVTELTERAVRAETKLEAIQVFQPGETPAGGDVSAQGGSWRQRLASWISGEG